MQLIVIQRRSVLYHVIWSKSKNVAFRVACGLLAAFKLRLCFFDIVQSAFPKVSDNDFCRTSGAKVRDIIDGIAAIFFVRLSIDRATVPTPEGGRRKWPMNFICLFLEASKLSFSSYSLYHYHIIPVAKHGSLLVPYYIGLDTPIG